MDLNILGRLPFSREIIDKNEIIKSIRTAFKLGYDVVALNTVIGPEQLEGKGSKIPEPVVVSLGKDDIPEAQVAGRTYKILSRLTAVVSDNSQCAKLMKSPVTSKYDIIAVNPQNVKVFQHICSSLEVDLISFDLTDKPQFHWKSNNLQQAKSRGIFFEVQYAPCFRDQSHLRYTIANANQLNELLKGKDIILSSGAKKMIELRGPFDVANLGHGVFGLKEEQAKAAIRSNCKKVVLHSEIRRKTGKGIVSVQDITKISESNKWLREACTFVVSVTNEAAGVADQSKSSNVEDSDEAESPPKKRRKEPPEKKFT